MLCYSIITHFIISRKACRWSISPGILQSVRRKAVERLHSSPARRAVAAAEAVEVVEVRASNPVFPVSSHLPSATATILRQLNIKDAVLYLIQLLLICRFCTQNRCKYFKLVQETNRVVRYESFYFTQGVTKRCRLSWLTMIAPSYTRPNAGRGGEGVEGSQPMNTVVRRSPNKFWRSNSIFNI